MPDRTDSVTSVKAAGRAHELAQLVREIASGFNLEDECATLNEAADLLADPHPRVDVWPVCDVCSVPYVLRHGFQFGGGTLTARWLWSKDCAKPKSTCKNAGIKIHDAEGEVPDDGR